MSDVSGPSSDEYVVSRVRRGRTTEGTDKWVCGCRAQDRGHGEFMGDLDALRKFVLAY